ncbi:hypothetical protein M407DRAFT_200974 [Tulasnella calospora MUT 4182]|uniref:Uncharacterized protein n=1 Tax=Tulasnella calospora MUT 4182 TaxID=1051891 RepID=A0A0C3LYK7_9AGAM|nr:hypothetical protein M407DRAFT_200974 [Tulasnella calospora MUT 4182]
MSGFRPFTSEPEKQARYEIFLNYHASPGPSMPYLARRPRQSEEEFRKELQDYAKAAMIFKPVSGAMADRFRTAVAQDVPKVVEALYYPAPVEESKESTESQKEKQQKEEDADPKRQAARMGMYGALTHETKEWRPVRLLCKRFGVPDPFMTKDGEAPPETASFGAGGNGPEPTSTTPVPSTATPSSSTSKPIDPPPPAAPGRKDIANIGLGEDETQGQDTLTYQRPPMDIFKAIFASDSEDDSDAEENEDQQGAELKSGLQQDSREELEPLQPASASAIIPMEVDEPQGPVDTSTFRPTFVSKATRDGKAEKDGLEKKEKKKKKAKPIVSFAADEDDGETDGLSIQPKKEKKRRREKEKEKEVSEDAAKKARTEDRDTEMQWVEKELPQPVETNPTSVPPRKPGRKTAADFL